MTFWLFYPLPLPLALAAAALPLAGGRALDLVLGDPRGFPHPVVYMGRAIRRFENHVAPLFPQSPQGQLAAGALLALALPLGSFLVSLGAIALAGYFLGFWASLALETFWCWQALALRDLQAESMAVYAPLCRGDLPAARKAVGRIVGRDTQALDEAGVARAAVETVAENLSDGVIAPLFYLAIGGAPLALWYKAVNTLDSMVGYKTPRCLYLGRFSARQDDAANFLPSRLAALALIFGAFLAGEEDLAAGPLPPFQPQQRPDRERLRRGPGGAPGGRCLLFWQAGAKAHPGRCPGTPGPSPYSPGLPAALFCGPALCRPAAGGPAGGADLSFLK